MDINWPSLLIICNGWLTHSMTFQVSDRGEVIYWTNVKMLHLSVNSLPFICKMTQASKANESVSGRLGYAYSKSLRILSRGNTWKSFKCDRGPIFQVTSLNINLTQFRPSEINCQPDPTGRNGSLRHMTIRNVFWSLTKATLESGIFIKLAKFEILSLKSP